MKRRPPTAREKKRYWLTFDAKGTTQPLIWEMSKRFDVIFNIRNSSVTDAVGIIAIELEGQAETISRAVRWFKRKGVQVDPVELNTIEG
jgi:ABC-type methionine transport system ATPase subunit